MEPPRAERLSGDRLHLNHGPIDLIIMAEGDREAAFAVASKRFATVLEELVAELPRLRRPVTDQPFEGSVARRMEMAVRPFAGIFVTPMAAVAGAVADEVLAAMTSAADLSRAAVNNGGDIAIHLAPGQRFELAMASASATGLGRISIAAEQGIGGVATSGRHGRSLSLGIADSVTVLAASAAAADAAATLLANAVDLPGHPAISRTPARDLDPDSDLGERLVTLGVGQLGAEEIEAALGGGMVAAETMIAGSLIVGAALFLFGETRVLGSLRVAEQPPEVGTAATGN